ncbi:hypothetical protein EXIGLDRAFT_437002 [Exidia glandulosa HHB12029]|uniref:DUF7223 domain-containing protein n=1 Tax=Exidia glandulosa HHB12029 TaxID=1314781 RepID=A0A165B8D3_EXIGL|nr:hypothetical protein EXIGLDRAFT_437002 [Exidia glandulosa HHB12029]
MTFNKRIVLAVLSIASVKAANDWSVPCVSGTCSYDTGDGVDTAYASLILNGPSTSLSDITPAAGWQISGCSPTWASGTQKVHVTCSGTDEETKHCEHVLQGGAVDKIVRLPQDCGAGPFARVVNWKTNSKRSRASKTHAVTLDFSFKNINPNGKGRVSFSATATNVRNNSTLSATNLRTRGRKRLLMSRFSDSDSIDAPPINLSKDFTLFDQSFNCPSNGGVGVDASLKVDMSVALDAQLTFGYTVAGTIIPPALTQLALTSTLNGDASAEFDVAASVKGNFDTGSVKIFQQGLPGLNFPGVLNLGPQFIVNGQVTADLGVQANVKAGAKWTFPTVSLIFPPDQGRSLAKAVPAQTPLDLSINPTASVAGALTGRIIPKVELGIDVLDGLAEATVFLDVEVSSTLGLQVTAEASASNIAAAKASANGCVTLDGQVDINAGATGAIKPIFDKNVSFNLLSKKAQLFQKCFNTGGDASTTGKSRYVLDRLLAEVSMCKPKQ